MEINESASVAEELAEEGREETTDTANGEDLFEINKQLATLSAGATVLIATFMKDIFPKLDTGALNLNWFAKGLIILAIGAFFIATVFSVLAMLPYNNFGKRSTNLSVFTFIAGIFFFAAVVYVSLNVPEYFREQPKAPDPATLTIEQ